MELKLKREIAELEEKLYSQYEFKDMEIKKCSARKAFSRRYP
jgi:hypothetical protein